MAAVGVLAGGLALATTTAATAAPEPPQVAAEPAPGQPAPAPRVPDLPVPPMPAVPVPVPVPQVADPPAPTPSEPCPDGRQAVPVAAPETDPDQGVVDDSRARTGQHTRSGLQDVRIQPRTAQRRGRAFFSSAPGVRS